MSDRVLFSEWAVAVDHGARLLGAVDGRSPCPICGHPTGDCTTHVQGETLMAENNKTAAKKAAENQKAETDAVIDTDPTEAGANTDLATAGVGDDAVVLKAGDPVDDSVFAKTEAGDEFVTLAKDVVEEFYFPGTKRPSYRLLYTKGQTVRRSAIETVNAAAKAKAAREGGDGEVKLENYIDSSTIASGTGSQPPVED